MPKLRPFPLMLIVFCMLALTSWSIALAEPVKSREQMMSAIKEAFQNKDADGLLSLQCFDGAAEDDARSVKDYLKSNVKQEGKVEEVSWLPPKGNEEKLSTMGGRAYKYNLPVVGRIKISFGKDETGEEKFLTYTIGQKGEELFMSMRIPAP